jgi:hypothetical protein
MISATDKSCLQIDIDEFRSDAVSDGERNGVPSCIITDCLSPISMILIYIARRREFIGAFKKFIEFGALD